MDLEIVIDQIKNRLNNFRQYYATNEQGTRSQLIDPFLREIGWDPTDPERVLLNSSNEDGMKPDYTFLKNEKAVLILEAKNTSVDINKREIINQLAQYCYNMGVKYGLLTNGIDWLLYDTFQTNPTDRTIMTINILNSNLDKIERLFSSVHFDNIDKIEENIQNLIKIRIIEKEIEDLWETNFENIQKLKVFIKEYITNQLKNKNIEEFLSVLNIDNFISKKINILFGNDNYEEQSEIHDYTTEISNIYTNLSKPNKIYDSKSLKIRVIFPDGTKFQNDNVTDTFVATLEKIGIAKIKNLNIVIHNVPLIANYKHPIYSQRKIGNQYIMVNLSTKNKYKYLVEINKRLNLNLKIELI